MPPLEPEWSEEEREPLQSATLDTPPSRSKASTLSALGIGGTAAGSAVVTGTAKAAGLAAAQGSGTSAIATGGKSLVVVKWLMLVALGGTAGGAALHYRAQSVTSPPAPVTPRTPASKAPAPESAAPKPEPVESKPAPVEVTPAPAKAAQAEGATQPDIALEIEALDRARRASERRDFATALRELDSYVRAMIEERRRTPADDLLSRMIAVEEEGDRLSTDELVMMTEAVLMAVNATGRAGRVVARGDRIEVALDGQTLFSVTDRRLAMPGALGVWSQADSVTHFGSFLVGPPLVNGGR